MLDFSIKLANKCLWCIKGYYTYQLNLYGNEITSVSLLLITRVQN